MKLLIGLFVLVASVNSFASTGETKTIVFDGSQNSVELILKGEETRTEYTVEHRPSVCYRTEIAGYRTVCSGGPSYPRPYPGPGPRPRPYPGHRQCTRTPVYRQVSYSCTQTVRIPYEVKEFDVEARVILDVSDLSGVASRETFQVTLLGDKLSLEAKGSGKKFVVLKQDDARRNVSGSVKFIDALYAVELVEAAPVTRALEVTNISIENSVLSFRMGPVAAPEHMGYSLNVVQKRTLASDLVLFDRELESKEIELAIRTSDSMGRVNVEALGLKLSGGKFGLTARAFFRPNGRLLNAAQFEALEASRTLIYTNR